MKGKNLKKLDFFEFFSYLYLIKLFEDLFFFENEEFDCTFVNTINE